MKALNLLICLLAVTLFVACSKKKDGGAQPGVYNNGRYGYTPNDPRYNMYPNGRNMPGYQMGNQQYGCNPPSNMYSQLGSVGGNPGYCSWLAQNGDRACSPMVARQLFMQYCAAYAQTYNYCVGYVQTGCFYSAGGCSYQGRRFNYSSTYVNPGSYRDRDGSAYVKKPTPAPVTPPVTVYPPTETKPTPVTPAPKQCTEKANDCYEVKPGKPETKRCRHPRETSSDKAKYTYLYETYLKLLQQTCDQTPVQQAPVVDSKPIQQAPVQQVPVVQAPVTQEKVTCVDLENRVARDCRLARPDRSSVARGTLKKNLLYADFQKGSDGKTYFDKENARGNIECKASGTNSNYIYKSYEQYVASLKKCTTETVTVVQPVVSAPIAQQPTVVNDNPVQTEELPESKPTKEFLSQCMNLQDLHNKILDPANRLSSYSAYDIINPTETGRSKDYLRAWERTFSSSLIASRSSVAGAAGTMSGIGLDVKQSGDSLQVDNIRGAGEIIDCRSGNQMTVKFVTESGDQFVSYKWNGHSDENLVIEETIEGHFALGNESGRYMVNRYVGVGKGLSQKEIYNKVTNEMKKSGSLRATSNSGNRYEVLKQSK